MTVLKLGVFLRLLNLLPLTAKSGWTANKDVNQNPSSTGITGQNLHVYQKNKQYSDSDFSSKFRFWWPDADSRGSASWKSFKVMEWCICSVFECGLRKKRYFSFFSFFLICAARKKRKSHKGWLQLLNINTKNQYFIYFFNGILTSNNATLENIDFSNLFCWFLSLS